VAAAGLPAALAARAAGPVPRVGVLLNTSQTSNLDDLRQGLRDLGYDEGRNVELDVLSAEGRLDRLPALARELVRREVDVIVASGPSGIGAARRATATIPIVMGRMDDVDAHGFVSTLAHPGGNVTGLSFQSGELAGKSVHVMKEAVPGGSRLAFIWHAAGTRNQLRIAQAAARTLGVRAQVLELRGDPDVEGAVGAARSGGADGLVVMASPAMTAVQGRLAQLALRSRLPAIYYNRAFAEAGGLLSYGPKASDFSWRRAAAFVDKILKGARPADLPVEQPTTFELVVNLRTARALGLTIPASVLVQADAVLE
jgi:putative ABC transport system substrate-binding protein